MLFVAARGAAYHCRATPRLQVLLLLQSSDRIAHDICHAFDSCIAAPDATPWAPTAGSAAGPDAAAPAAAPQQVPEAAEQHRNGQQGAAAAAASGISGASALPQHVLVLRTWRELRPGREFRCFVRSREIVGEKLSHHRFHVPFM